MGKIRFSSGDHRSTASRARMTTLYSPSAPAGSFTRPVHASGAPLGSRWHPRSSRPTSGSQSPSAGAEPTTSASPSPVQSGIENASRTTRSVAGASPSVGAVPRSASAEEERTTKDAARRASGAGASRPRRPARQAAAEAPRRAGGALARTPEAEAEARPVAAAAGAGAGATATMTVRPEVVRAGGPRGVLAACSAGRDAFEARDRRWRTHARKSVF